MTELESAASVMSSEFGVGGSPRAPLFSFFSPVGVSPYVVALTEGGGNQTIAITLKSAPSSQVREAKPIHPNLCTHMRLVRRWLLIGYFPIHTYYHPTTLMGQPQRHRTVSDNTVI